MPFPHPNDTMGSVLVLVSAVLIFHLIYGFDFVERSIECRMVLNSEETSFLNKLESLLLLKKLSDIKKRIFLRSAFYQNLGSIFHRFLHTSCCAVFNEVMAHETNIYMIYKYEICSSQTRHQQP